MLGKEEKQREREVTNVDHQEPAELMAGLPPTGSAASSLSYLHPFFASWIIRESHKTSDLQQWMDYELGMAKANRVRP